MTIYAVRGIAVKHRVTAIYVGFVAVLAFSAFAAGLQSHDRVISQTRTHKLSVQEQLGKPEQSLDGAQVNPQLKGFVCDVYRGPTIICHR